MGRGAIYELCEGRPYLTKGLTWSQEGFPPPRESIEISMCPWFLGQLLSGQPVIPSDANALPSEASA